MKLIDILKEIGDASAGQFPFTSKTKAIQQEARKAIKDIKDTVEFNSSYFKDPNSWKGTSQPGKTIIWDVKGNRKLRYLVEIDWEVTLKSRKGGQDQFSTWARIDFDVKGNTSWVQDTNAREQYQLMATIVAIYKEFADAVEPIAPLDGGAFYAKADSEESQAPDLNSRRSRLYAQYITKNLNQLPGQWKIKANKDQQRIEIIRTKKESIKEIGDASKKPYGPIDVITDDEAERQYGFSTDSGTIYEVKVETFYQGPTRPVIARVLFGIIGQDGDISYDAQTGENDIYRIMSTIVEIVKKDLKSNHADIIEFSPSKREGDKDKDPMSNVRTKLYSKYIKGQFPNAEVTQTIHGDIRVILNK